MAAGDVLTPPTTSTSGMICGGLNGCPITQRSGRLQPDCMTLIVIPDELEAMIESGGVASSMPANNLILKSGRSGPFSWTKSASESAALMFDAKLSRSRAAPRERPMVVSAGHASSTYFRRLASAFGAGSVATTSNPRARYWAAQLAPMTPVPTIAIWRVQAAPIEIQLQVDWLRQAVEQHLDVAAMGRFSPGRDLDAGAEDAPPLGVVRPFLRPVDLSACGIDGDPDAPARLVAPVD